MSVKETSVPDSVMTGTDLESQPDEKVSPQDHQLRPEDVEEKLPSEFTPRSILVLLGTFLLLFCSVGFVNAWGVFQEYYSEGLLKNTSSSTIAWIGSINLFCMFGPTIIVGYLNDKFGPRILLIVGAFTVLFGLFMTSLCKEYYQFFLAQGLVFGVGLSFLVLPAFVTVPRYFARNRAVALGVTVSGSSLGGVIWPIALRNLFADIGFGWGVRTSAFIMLPLLAFAIFTIRLPIVPASDSINGKPTKVKPDMSIVKNPVLLLLSASLFFIYLGLFSPLFYMTSYTISLGLDADMAFYMLSIINAASLFGRILPGLLADRIGAYNILIVSAGTSGIICMCWTRATSMGGIVVFSLAYGFASGAVISLQGACAAQIAKPAQYGVALGTVMAILSLSGLIGSPINGQIAGKWEYLGLSLFSGLAMLIGMLILIVAKLKLNPNFLGKA